MAKSIATQEVNKIVVACEAGVGSSLMITNQLKKKVKQANLEVKVDHCPARAIPKDAQVVVVHKSLSKLAREKAPWAVVISFDNFMSFQTFDHIVKTLQDNSHIEEKG